MNNFSIIKEAGKRKMITVISGRISRKIYTGYYPVYCLYDLDDTVEQAMIHEKENFKFIPAVIRAGSLCSLLRVTSPISGISLKSSFKYNPASLKDFIIFQPENTDPIEKNGVDFSGVDTIQSVINRWASTPDIFKENLDIPENRAFRDMGLADEGYLNIKERTIKADRTYYNVNVNDDINNVVRIPVRAGGLDRACFSELCVQYNNMNYRLEMKTGREVSKQKNIEWIASKCNCNFWQAARLRDCFNILQLDDKAFYYYIYKVFNLDKVIRYKNTDLNILEKMKNNSEYHERFQAELINLEILAGRIAGIKLENDKFNVYQYDENGKDIQAEYLESLQDEDLIEMNFKESLDVDANNFTVKRLSTPEESLHENLIYRIQNADYSEYLKLNAEFHDSEYGNLKSVSVSSAFSQGMLLMKEKKAFFDKIKDAEIKKAAAAVDSDIYEAIKAYKKNDSKRNKYRLLISIHGGVWDDIEIKKVDKSTAQMLWLVINKKM